MNVRKVILMFALFGFFLTLQRRNTWILSKESDKQLGLTCSIKSRFAAAVMFVSCMLLAVVAMCIA